MVRLDHAVAQFFHDDEGPAVNPDDLRDDLDDEALEPAADDSESSDSGSAPSTADEEDADFAELDNGSTTEWRQHGRWNRRPR